MRILFAGTPRIAVPSLKVIDRLFTVVGVLTAPDRPAGRGRAAVPSAVKLCADELGLRVLQPASLGAEAREQAAALQAELLVVFAYGRIFGPRFLALFRQGGINMHPSALPLYRGPSPLTAALLAGDECTALTVQRIALEMDAGDILSQRPLPIAAGETSGSLGAKAAEAAAGELADVIGRLAAGRAEGRPQDHARATYCRAVKKEDGRIDWGRPARDIERMIRAYQPWPRAFTTLGDKRLILLESEVLGGAGSGSGAGGIDGSGAAGGRIGWAGGVRGSGRIPRYPDTNGGRNSGGEEASERIEGGDGLSRVS